MDLVSRLKQYLTLRGIGITQFADECDIPRPTASQLLAGRNKKVSDEIIGKIHFTYPDLSVTWLMFGEGDMSTEGNIATSEPENALKKTFQRFKYLTINRLRQLMRVCFLIKNLNQKKQAQLKVRKPRNAARNFRLATILFHSHIWQPLPTHMHLSLPNAWTHRCLNPTLKQQFKGKTEELQGSLSIIVIQPMNRSSPILMRNIRSCVDLNSENHRSRTIRT